MKKQYLSPRMHVVRVDCTTILSASVKGMEKVTVSDYDYDEEKGLWD